MITPSEQISELLYLLAEDDLVQLMHQCSFRLDEAGVLLRNEGDVCDDMVCISFRENRK